LPAARLEFEQPRHQIADSLARISFARITNAQESHLQMQQAVALHCVARFA
jgi:hypothetical protein